MAITVTVIYPADDEHTPERAWTWEAPGPDVAQALAQSWREFNVVHDGDPHLARQARSMMVGDLIQVNGTTYVVDRYGFTPLPAEEVAAWRRLPSRDRCFGPDFARRHGLM